MMSKLTRWTMVGFVGLALVALAGCGGTALDDDGGYDPGDPNYPQYRYLTIALRIVDGSGHALGGATVWVDGEANSVESDDQFHPLDNHYPYAWQGWAANWESDEYSVVINYPGDQDRFPIRVEKPGWTADTTMVTIHDWEPSDIYIRDVMVLWNTQTQGAAARAAHSAEVVPYILPKALQPTAQRTGTLIMSTDDVAHGGSGK